MTNRTPAQLKQHYKDYQGTPEQIKKRAMRNRARADMEKKHGAAALAGKDVDHRKAIRNGGTNGKGGTGNLRIRSIKANRGDTT